MSDTTGVTALFLDIGGVLLSNGWDRQMRGRAAQQFGLDFEEMNERHHLIFDAYERGRLSLADYLAQVVFHAPRPFKAEAFKDFMFTQSQPIPGMITLIRRIKARYPVKIVAVSNEGRELNEHRIRSFGLAELIDFFVSSCFVNLRKPEPEIYRAALDMAQVTPSQVIYCDDREMFVEVARTLGIRAFRHQSLETTRAALCEHGLSVT